MGLPIKNTKKPQPSHPDNDEAEEQGPNDGIPSFGPLHWDIKGRTRTLHEHRAMHGNYKGLGTSPRAVRNGFMYSTITFMYINPPFKRDFL